MVGPIRPIGERAQSMTLLSKIKNYKTAILVLPFLALSFYSCSVNFSPTPIFKQFAPVFWMPIGLFLAYVIVRDPKCFKEKARSFPLWRKLIAYAVFSGITCLLAHILFVFGIADMVTRMIGTPFHESCIIVKKTSTRRICSHRIDVDKFQSAMGGICLDELQGNLADDHELIWETTKKGDEVILVGKKSRFGRSVTNIMQVKQ
jgi:hypothetical protein